MTDEEFERLLACIEDAARTTGDTPISMTLTILGEARRARRAEADLRTALREIQDRVAALAEETEIQTKKTSGTWKIKPT